MRINPLRRKPIKVILDASPPREPFWRLKFSDLLVISLAALTFWVAYDTLQFGSTEAKQNQEIGKIDSQVSELKYIDTVALRQLNGQDTVISRISLQLSLLSKAYLRSTQDSIDTYFGDSLQWRLAAAQVDVLLLAIHYHFYALIPNSDTVPAESKLHLIDTIDQLKSALFVAFTKNAFLRKHPLLRSSAQDFVSSLDHFIGAVTYDDGKGNFEKVIKALYAGWQLWEGTIIKPKHFTKKDFDEFEKMMKAYKNT